MSKDDTEVRALVLVRSTKAVVANSKVAIATLGSFLPGSWGRLFHGLLERELADAHEHQQRHRPRREGDLLH